MAIIRRKDFGSIATADAKNVNTDLIDTPEKLLSLARSRNVQISPLDVVSVATKLFNIEVAYVDFEEDISGKLLKDETSNRWSMYVNKNHHPNRRRYTIAHELGHYCLHRKFESEFEDQIFFRGGETSRQEWQANDFASAILIPEEDFRARLRAGDRDVESLAKVFEVSTLALRLRAKSLGMTGHGL